MYKIIHLNVNKLLQFTQYVLL